MDPAPPPMNGFLAALAKELSEQDLIAMLLSENADLQEIGRMLYVRKYSNRATAGTTEQLLRLLAEEGLIA
jgi:hypothetical protein